MKLIAIDRGYQPANLLTARIANFATGQPANARAQFYTDVLERLQATPGVTHAALGDELPLTPQSGSARIPGTNPVNPDRLMEESSTSSAPTTSRPWACASSAGGITA